MSETLPDDIRTAVVHDMWRNSDLTYLLHSGQLEAMGRFVESGASTFVIECARRWGKSWLACVTVIAFALSRPKAQIRYAAPTQKMVRTITIPLIREILEDCPPELMPSFSVVDGIWRFQNGSEVHIAGVDNGGADRLRGVSTDLAVVDEAGFVDDLEYLVKSVLRAQLLTAHGSMLLISTPAVSPDHAWTGYCERAEADGAYHHATIHDAPHLSAEQVEEFARELGGVDSVAFRREALAQRVTDLSRAVVPEFADAEKDIVREWPMPEHFVPWVSGDIGFIDMSVFAVAYTDFLAAKIVIVDEVAMQRSKSTDINVAVAKKEREHFGSIEPRLRVIDAAAITIADMDETVDVEREERASALSRPSNVRAMSWQLASKDDADAALNALRLSVSKRQLIIHPRCRVIRSHMKNAIWNRSRTSFERVERDGIRHHFDGVDAVKYLVRAADLGINPYPALPRGVSLDTHHIRPAKNTLSQLFKGRTA